MSNEMDNVDRLIKENVIESRDSVSREHQDVLNEMTAEELNGIIKLKQKIVGAPLSSDPGTTGGGIL